MIYLFYGLERLQIDSEIKKVIKDNSIDEFSISRFDAKQNTIEQMFLDADSMSLFGSKRAIIIDNAYYFTGEKAEKNEDNLIKIEKYLNNYNKNNIIIFIVNAEKLDERKKITKLINKVGKVINFNQKSDINEISKTLLKNYNIDYKSLALIKEKLNNQNELAYSEIEKLITYKENSNITNEDINLVISEYPKIDFFEFIDNIINKKTKESIKTYQELLKLKEEPIKIIVTLANQFRLMYQAKKLNESGYTEKDIATKLGEHPYRVKLAIQKSRNYSDKDLLENLKRLGEININAKKGLVDSETSLELFILGI